MIRMVCCIGGFSQMWKNRRNGKRIGAFGDI